MKVDDQCSLVSCIKGTIGISEDKGRDAGTGFATVTDE